MVNVEHKLTVDDLIVEYMIYKVKNGYEPQFSASEFMTFLSFFERKMPVQDSLYESEKLFRRFFQRKAEQDWLTTKNWSTSEKVITPHMEMEYSEKDGDYIIRANYKLSIQDKSLINTYFMDNGMSKLDNFKGTAFQIRNIIGEYLVSQPKRKIDESVKVDGKNVMIGKYLSAEIITHIWRSYIENRIALQMWPKQCTDINKYLLDFDLATMIDVPSIKDDLLALYNALSKRIAILYQQDRNLKVNSDSYHYLARANYELLIQGYEDIIGMAFGPSKKSMEFDLSSLTFKESHEINGVYYWDDDPDIKTTMTVIENEKVKKIVRNIESAEQEK